MGRYLKDKKDRRAGLDLFTPQEEEVLLTATLKHVPRHYCLLLCALRTGLRIGELFGLQWDDLDFGGRFIEVRRTLKDGRQVFPPKNGRMRRVDMSLQLAEELKRQRVQQSREALAKGWGRVPWVFTDSQGNPLRKNNFGRRVFRNLLRMAGLRPIRFHALRHTFASRLLQNRESPVYVKDQLGHSSIKITVDTYGHLIPGANKAAVDRLDVTGRNPAATEDGNAKSGTSVSI